MCSVQSHTHEQTALADAEEAHDKMTNADAISGEHGAHPLGVAAGAAAGAVVGAVMGGVGGPVGVMAGAAAGGLAGGIAGKGLGEVLNPSLEDEYWKENFVTRTYYIAKMTYDHYRPAYRLGWESIARYPGRKWDEVENDLMRDWLATEPKLEWSKAKPATRDAWERVEKSLPCDKKP